MHPMVFDHYGDPDLMKREKTTYLSGSRMYMAVQRMLRSLNSQGRGLQLSELCIAQRALVSLLALVLWCVASPQSLVAQTQPGPPEAASGPSYTQ
jgi:hypothetical protein